MTGVDPSARVVPYHCPYCASQDLHPQAEPSQAWQCRACLRSFVVTYAGRAGARL